MKKKRTKDTATQTYAVSGGEKLLEKSLDKFYSVHYRSWAKHVIEITIYAKKRSQSSNVLTLTDLLYFMRRREREAVGCVSCC